MKQRILQAGIACLAMFCAPAFGQIKGAGSFVFTASSVSVKESAGVVKVSVTRVNGSRGAVTVNLATASGTATSGLDFTPVNQTLTFASGDAGPRSVKIEILEDRLRERTETFTVTLSNPTGGATIGTPGVETIGILDSTLSGLALTSSVPANGSTGVNRSSAIQLNFSATLDAATAPGNIRLQTVPGATLVPTTLSVTGSQVTLTPLARLDPLAQYATLIDVGLRGANGETLPAAINIGFTTRDRGWLGAQLVETENLGDATAARVAFDCNGNAWAVWVQYNGVRNSVRASRYIPGSGWQNPATAIENNVGDGFNPQLAIDGAGNILVTWQQKDSPTHYDTWANRYTAGAGWGVPTLIETGAGSALGPGRIAMDPGGNAIAVWPQSSADPAHQDIWANRYVVGSGWSTATLLGPLNAGTSFEPEIGIDGAGNAIVTWRQSPVPAGIFSVWSNRYTTGTGWNGPQMIESNASAVWFPTVAVDAPGNALALWSESGAPDDIWFNRYVAGAGWGIATPFGNPSRSQDAQIALDAAGDGMAAWRQADSGAVYSLWGRRYSATTGWEPASRIDTLSAGTTTAPRIAADPAGNAIAVWNRQDTSTINVWANRYKAGTGWGAAELLETTLDYAFNPQIAIDAAGNAMAVWTQFDGTRYNIWSNRFE